MLSANKYLTYDSFIVRLKEEEVSQQTVTVAMAVSPGAQKFSGRKSGSLPTDRYPCSHCGQMGHWHAQRPKRNGVNLGKGKGNKHS